VAQVSCWLHLCWLSWVVFLVTLFLAAAIGVQFFITEAERLFKLAREEQDQLFKHFRVTDELKNSNCTSVGGKP